LAAGKQAGRQAGTAGGGIQGVKNLVMFLVPVVTVLHSNYVIYRVLVVGNLYSSEGLFLLKKTFYQEQGKI
jgi:hypothetical protein